MQSVFTLKPARALFYPVLNTPFNAYWLNLNYMIPNMMGTAKNHNIV